jgi:flagellar hook-length control protein FliK
VGVQQDKAGKLAESSEVAKFQITNTPAEESQGVITPISGTPLHPTKQPSVLLQNPDNPLTEKHGIKHADSIGSHTHTNLKEKIASSQQPDKLLLENNPNTRLNSAETSRFVETEANANHVKRPVEVAKLPDVVNSGSPIAMKEVPSQDDGRSFFGDYSSQKSVGVSLRSQPDNPNIPSSPSLSTGTALVGLTMGNSQGASDAVLTASSLQGREPLRSEGSGNSIKALESQVGFSGAFSSTDSSVKPTHVDSVIKTGLHQTDAVATPEKVPRESLERGDSHAGTKRPNLSADLSLTTKTEPSSTKPGSVSYSPENSSGFPAGVKSMSQAHPLASQHHTAVLSGRSSLVADENRSKVVNVDTAKPDMSFSTVVGVRSSASQQTSSFDSQETTTANTVQASRLLSSESKNENQLGNGSTKSLYQPAAKTDAVIGDSDDSVSQMRNVGVDELPGKVVGKKSEVVVNTASQLNRIADSTNTLSGSGMIEVPASNVYHATSNGIITANTPLNAGISGDLINAPRTVLLNQPGAEQTLTDNVRWAVNEKMSRVTVNVTPANLGPITVSVDVESQNMSVSIITNNTVAKEAIDGLLPRMREHFTSEGYQQVSVDVSSQQKQHSNSDSRTGDSDKQQGGFDAEFGENQTLANPIATSVVDQRNSHNSLIDTYV